ncbi:hypothetical protein CEXT_705261 [Caerostris extrusa]|uniref:Uncharacterized protein n=1 Tax=Caerostris extrusa TaxID=172846 RepID=A0AAV4PK62_CAEEX|nr:hypothetical protein CEXT_705261 [Caerostris extrusa]
MPNSRGTERQKATLTQPHLTMTHPSLTGSSGSLCTNHGERKEKFLSARIGYCSFRLLCGIYEPRIAFTIMIIYGLDKG